MRISIINLNEDINNMKKFYLNIPDDEFMSYIELDPTYKEGSNSAGKYARWILGLADKGKLDNLGHIKDLLLRFENEKKNLVDKNIMKYKSVEEVEDALSSISDKLELTDRQKERRLRNDLADAELVAEDDNWEVWIPHSYAASCTLGKGTKWCTAYSKDDYHYNQYSKNGDLIIFINKHNPKEKYQYHDESHSFRNADDRSERFYLFIKERLSNSIKDYLKNKYPKIEPILNFNGTWIYDEQKSIPSSIAELVKKVIIPEDVTSIGDNAFYGCSSLTNITIPNSVTRIGKAAFSHCSNLMSVTIPDSVRSIGSVAFNGCVKLTSIIIPNKVTSIEDYAFYHCTGLTSVTIGNNVKSIGERAFYECAKLTSITIPNNMTSIGERAFECCYNLVEVYNKSPLNITKGSTNYGYVGYYAKVIYTKPYTSKLSTESNGYILYTDGDDISLMGYNGTDTDLILPAGITEICQYAFYNCKKLTNITFPNSITSIGNKAFWGCTGLTSIIIPDGVRSIGEWAFYHCSGLTSITIPDSVTRVGSNAFSDCPIKTAIIPAISSLCVAINTNSTLETVVITSGTSIRDYAFRECYGLKNITIPDSVTSIGSYAFYECKGLTNITFTGTKAQWNAVIKEKNWDYNTGTYEVHCKGL